MFLTSTGRMNHVYSNAQNYISKALFRTICGLRPPFDFASVFDSINPMEVWVLRQGWTVAVAGSGDHDHGLLYLYRWSASGGLSPRYLKEFPNLLDKGISPTCTYTLHKDSEIIDPHQPHTDTLSLLHGGLVKLTLSSLLNDESHLCSH